PDEGTSKTAKLDCESEDKQIRFWEQAKGLRDSRRFAVGFFSRVHTFPSSFRIGFAAIQARAESPKRRAKRSFAVRSLFFS
ncbi:hypothetical protein, partial [Methanocorpusculum parvum]|uniref:hypothetical protein n=1 Tax=Methanocorpusculum parvum TaxID=2193 RepID=UPI00296EE2EF